MAPRCSIGHRLAGAGVPPVTWAYRSSSRGMRASCWLGLQDRATRPNGWARIRRIFLRPDPRAPGTGPGRRPEPVVAAKSFHLSRAAGQVKSGNMCRQCRARHDAAPRRRRSIVRIRLSLLSRRRLRRPGVGWPGELGDRLIDPRSRVSCPASRILARKFLPDRQSRHWLHPPWPLPRLAAQRLLDDHAHERRLTGTLRAGRPAPGRPPGFAAQVPGRRVSG